MKIHCGLAALAFVALTASDGVAQSRAMGSFRGLFTAHVGAAAGGEVSDPRGTLGLSVSVQEQDGWGAELDFGRTSDAVSGVQILDLTTYMVNAAWIRPEGFIRPFGIAGAGILQINGCDTPCNRPANTYDLGLTFGGGVLAVLNDTVGVRGDARYFFASADHPDLRRPDNFGFWRISVGATLMWAIAP
jgi:opacity protein-like surface antigen